MKNEIKLFLGMSIIIGLVTASAVWFNIVKAGPRDISIAVADQQLTSQALAKQFTDDFEKSRTGMYDQVLEVEGKFLEIENSDTLVVAYMDASETYHIRFELLPASFEKARALKPGASVKIKGIFAGADQAGDNSDPVAALLGESFGMIKLKQATILE